MDEFIIEKGDIVTDYAGNPTKKMDINNVYIVTKDTIKYTVVYLGNKQFDILDKVIIDEKYTVNELIDNEWIPLVTTPMKIDDIMELLHEGQILQFIYNGTVQNEMILDESCICDPNGIFTVIASLNDVVEKATDILDDDSDDDIFDIPLTIVPASLLVEYFTRYVQTVKVCRQYV